MTNCPHALDDGAYVMGALSPSERAEYERHLAGCAECREAVAEIAVLPGLLGRLDVADVEALAPPPAPPDRMPALLAAAREVRRRERRTRRRRYVVVGAAAGALAVAVGVAGVTTGWFGAGAGGGGTGATSADGTRIGVRMVTMQPVDGAVPVSAEIGLNGTTWGTEIAMKCSYAKTGNRTKAWTFRLVAHGADGAKEQVGSWVAAPGETVSVVGATRFGGQELVRLELTRYDGTPLLAYDVP